MSDIVDTAIAAIATAAAAHTEYIARLTKARARGGDPLAVTLLEGAAIATEHRLHRTVPHTEQETGDPNKWHGGR